MGFQPAVDACGISLEGGADLGRSGREHGLGDSVQSQGANVGIGFENFFAQHFGKPTGSRPARELHLPQAILGVYVTQREIGVRCILGENVRHGVAVADDLDPFDESRDSDAAADRRQGGSEPEVSGAKADQQHHDQTYDNSDRFAKHGSLPMTLVFRR